MSEKITYQCCNSSPMTPDQFKTHMKTVHGIEKITGSQTMKAHMDSSKEAISVYDLQIKRADGPNFLGATKTTTWNRKK